MDEQQYQVFVMVKEDGEISSCEIGIPVVRSEPADFFFLVDGELALKLKEDAQSYKVVLNGMKPELVLIDSPIEEAPVEEATLTEEVTTPEN